MIFCIENLPKSFTKSSQYKNEFSVLPTYPQTDQTSLKPNFIINLIRFTTMIHLFSTSRLIHFSLVRHHDENLIYSNQISRNKMNRNFSLIPSDFLFRKKTRKMRGWYFIIFDTKVISSILFS